MRRAAFAIALIVTPACAQQASPARRPAFDLALEAAQAANAACTAQGVHTVALVVDAANNPVVLLSADGAVAIAGDFALRKTAAVIQYRQSSGEVAARAAKDPALAAEVKANPKIGFALAGALPMLAGNDQIGAIAVSGGSGPAGDEACARAGLDKVKARLR
jgi:uncharacterized protein GlcG (DUF336 family)